MPTLLGLLALTNIHAVGHSKPRPPLVASSCGRYTLTHVYATCGELLDIARSGRRIVGSLDRRERVRRRRLVLDAPKQRRRLRPADAKHLTQRVPSDGPPAVGRPEGGVRLSGGNQQVVLGPPP